MSEFKERRVENLRVWVLVTLLSFLLSVSLVYVDHHKKYEGCIPAAALAAAGIVVDTSSGVLVLDCPVK